MDEGFPIDGKVATLEDGTTVRIVKCWDFAHVQEELEELTERYPDDYILLTWE